MKDPFGREIRYLRISVTDLCNLRCRYCMPAEGVCKKNHGAILSFEEITEIAAAAVALGVRKIRLTGGEPLVRRGLPALCRALTALPGLDELTMTTNGVLLPQYAAELKAAGLTRVNISLDTLDPQTYRDITRGGSLDDAFAGIRSAFTAGLTPVKLNAVLLGGVNDGEIPALTALTRDYPIELRFIELMPIGAPVFGPEAYLPCSTVLERVPSLQPLAAEDGVAALYRLPGGKGRVGLIRPLSCGFCARCDRLRLTADGRLKPCLHSAEEIPVKGLHGDALTDALRLAVAHKPAAHAPLSAERRSNAARGMDRIGG